LQVKDLVSVKFDLTDVMNSKSVGLGNQCQTSMQGETLNVQKCYGTPKAISGHSPY